MLCLEGGIVTLLVLLRLLFLCDLLLDLIDFCLTITLTVTILLRQVALAFLLDRV